MLSDKVENVGILISNGFLNGPDDIPLFICHLIGVAERIFTTAIDFNHLLLVAQADEVVRHLNESGIPVENLPLDRKALTSAGDMRLYETHLDGSITSLQGEDGYFSDENPMNRFLEEFNERYAQLLELQDAHD